MRKRQGPLMEIRFVFKMTTRQDHWSEVGQLIKRKTIRHSNQLIKKDYSSIKWHVDLKKTHILFIKN